jgi:hypothetical protein
MANKGGGAVLDVRGRDVESDELAIQFSKDSCRWTILGSAAEVHQSEQRKAIIAALVDRSEPMRINTLVAATGMKRNPLELLLGKMVKAQLIKRTGSGLYAHKDYANLPKSAKAADMHKSLRSVSPTSPAGQISDGGQPTDGTKKGADICLSVRSARKFTSKADVPVSVVERVKTRTDQTGGQIEAQATEEAKKTDSENLSDSQTDQADGRMLTHVKAAYEERRLRSEAAPTDDPSIPEWLLRRDEPLCAQCGLPGGTEWDYDDLKVRLHLHCEQAWIDARRNGATACTGTS